MKTRNVTKSTVLKKRKVFTDLQTIETKLGNKIVNKAQNINEI